MKKGVIIVLTAAASLIGSMNATAAEKNLLIYAGNSYAEENNTAEVSIMIEENPGVSAFSVELRYDPEVLVYEEAEAGRDISCGTLYCNGEYSENSVKLVWSDSKDFCGQGEAAVVKFRTRNGTAETASLVNIGYSEFVNKELEGMEYEAESGKVKIAQKIKLGDTNCSGIVDISDVVLLNKYIIDGEKYSFKNIENEANSDVNGDGKIDILDSGLIIDYLSGIMPEGGEQ